MRATPGTGSQAHVDTVDLSRLQFGLTIAFHYIYPPFSIGLGVCLVIMEGRYLATGQALYQQVTRFWVRVFGLTFAIGVASGIVMEFQFGTNWAAYSRFVGDVFGSALAAEGIFAFFLESGFLALLLFGWDRVGPRTHFLATVMVALGAHFSAVWIIIANSWMQTPAGFRIVGEGAAARAETTDFWQVVFNPSTVDRLSHTLAGAWQAGAFLVLSISAWYLLKNRHVEFARASFRVGLGVAVIATIGSFVSGDASARRLATTQPAKLAAMEAVFPASGPAGLHLFGWVDEQARRTYGPEIPGMLSWLVHFDTRAPVTGLEAFPRQDWPPVNRVFQAFHLMVALGVALLALALVGAFFLWRGTLFTTRWLLWLFVPAVVGPQLAGQLGWMTAEFGRQPWIVYGIMRTADGVSPRLSATEVGISVVLFSIIYLLLFALFLYLLDQKIRHGPSSEDLIVTGRRAWR
jgi:cytochrome d ubiquinol oxidase subunit I